MFKTALLLTTPLLSAFLWAQATPDTSAGLPPWLAALLSGGSTTAILGWYAWHNTTRTIPGLVTDFRSDMKAMHDLYSTEKKNQRDAYVADSEKEREQFLVTLTAEREAWRIDLREERTSRDRNTERLEATLRELTTAVIEATKKAHT